MRRGFASPLSFTNGWGCAPGSAFGPKNPWAKPEPGAQPIPQAKLDGEAEPRLTSGGEAGGMRPDGSLFLRGQVVRPTLKPDAEASVRDVEGITRIVNDIEVLPVSPNDDRLRVALYRAIYKFDSPLFRYDTRAVPPIHILVKNGRATLKGVVASKADSDLAYMAARSVPGVFDVTNELRVESEIAR